MIGSNNRSSDGLQKRETKSLVILTQTTLSLFLLVNAVNPPLLDVFLAPRMWGDLCLPLLLLLVWNNIGVTKASQSIFLPSQTGVDGSRSFRSSNPVCSSPDPNLNYRPVIGILSHPGDGASGRLLSNDTSSSYIAASYVKFAEAGGARVIPLIYNEPEELLFQVIPEICSFTPYFSSLIRFSTVACFWLKNWIASQS